MSVRIKNTADDRLKAHLHRTTPKLVQEPSLLGRRIRLGETITISDEDYARNKATIDAWVSHGVVEVLDKPVDQATLTNYGRVNPETGRSVMAELAGSVSDGILKGLESPEDHSLARSILPPVPVEPVVETQTPLTMGGEVVITETAPSPEVVAEVLPPIAPAEQPAVPAPTPPVVETPAPADKKGPGKKKLI